MKVFDKRTKDDEFQVGDLVLKWDARNEDKEKSLIIFGNDLIDLLLSMETMHSFCMLLMGSLLVEAQ